ncbi:hypothetical protein ABMA28_017179 [Loxostege sticticalis]|uniref:Neuroglobin n=1 Tax=Loxostege sticticalis TaxID=481309 RepID=A0ABD0S2H4_LOXSC
MGCKLGKMVASERQRGGAANQDLGGGPPPATDPRLPLTAKQKYSMLASWKGISRAMEKTGICMFIKTFFQTTFITFYKKCFMSTFLKFIF